MPEQSILEICLTAKSTNPIYILEQLMSLPTIPMHGPIHHVLVGSALLTAYRNAGGDINLKEALIELEKRAANVPGGACGFWGACGACISTGMFVSIVTKASPLTNESWGLANSMTSRALARLAAIGGPRCCKRNSYLAVTEAVTFTADRLGIQMDITDITCTRSSHNSHCIGADRCPFCRKEVNDGQS